MAIGIDQAIISLHASDELKKRLSSKLASGTFHPRLPITIDAPKYPGFTRPVSILWPYELLAYQLSVDATAREVEDALDRLHVFSYKLLDDDPNGFMFHPLSECFSNFQVNISEVNQYQMLPRFTC